MNTLAELASDFLAQERIAVVGVSRNPQATANAIYRALRAKGYHVFAVNPHAGELEGDRCWSDVATIDGGVDAALIVTPPDASAAAVRACAERGIRRVWLHRSLGQGSRSDEAVRIGREAGLTVIPGACPMMFLPGTDAFHRCLGWIFRRVRMADLPPAPPAAPPTRRDGDPASV
jgi:hypothetical protein